ncbi:hypothetical protein B4U79_11089 [Dinothrombium tinctorium]|uniref:Ig-like domain-containing protein n=1 Tax=Dinothrombium tinctorium TaxID=1965070 RepID=A0A3S3S923_9ACAR|nr:hypothetical protein B4U79_11089 [Dinothrombium tinctorium]
MPNITYSPLHFNDRLLISLVGPCFGRIKITSLLIPERIENGTEDSVILDCIYTLDENDDNKLVVKWFLDNDPEPIYQWIPEYESRQPSKRLQGRINMNFAVSANSRFTKYRAINIIRPSTDISGTYSCHVMSLTSEDSKEKKMIVYGMFCH